MVQSHRLGWHQYLHFVRRLRLAIRRFGLTSAAEIRTLLRVCGKRGRVAREATSPFRNRGSARNGRLGLENQSRLEPFGLPVAWGVHARILLWGLLFSMGSGEG
jgi:hypothetical protein